MNDGYQRRPVTVTLYVDRTGRRCSRHVSVCGSSRCERAERYLRSILGRYPPSAYRLVIQDVAGETFTGEVPAVPMLMIRGPHGPEILLGALDEHALATALARSGLSTH